MLSGSIVHFVLVAVRSDENAAVAAALLSPSYSLAASHASDVLDMPVDPNEPTYCLCHQVSYGEMIGCDNIDVSPSVMFLLTSVYRMEQTCHTMSVIVSVPVFPRQILPISTAQFAKFCSTVMPKYPTFRSLVGVVVLTDNTSKCKVFIVTCNTKTHYIGPLVMKISS